MRFIILGTSEFTLSCARAVLDSGNEVCALISLPKRRLPLNSADIFGFAKARGVYYHEIEDINSADSIGLIRSYSADYIFSSWPKILKKRILSVPKEYVIGTHPTALPFNRGRHPLHWLIVLGIRNSKLSFFVMDEGVDTGRILLQIPFKNAKNGSINDVAANVNKIAYKGAKRLCEKLHESRLRKGIKQDHLLSNSWRKRDPFDVTLDPRMSAGMILRTIRSFSPPYPGANLFFGKYVIKVINARRLKVKMPYDRFQRMEHGKVLCIRGNKISIRVDDGIVELESRRPIPVSLLKEKYVHPPAYYIWRTREKGPAV